MKKILLALTLFAFCMYSCNEKPQKKLAQPKVVTSNDKTPTKIAVAHYICPKKCKGGTSGAQGSCPVCFSILSHNQAFHNTTANKSKAGFSPVAPPTIPISNIPAPATQPGPNYAGQYHYTCTNGCVKGGDTAGKCKNCSGELAHNAAFQQ